MFQMNVDPEDLIPKLPKPKDLQPFPTTQAIVIILVFKTINFLSFIMHMMHDMWISKCTLLYITVLAYGKYL